MPVTGDGVACLPCTGMVGRFALLALIHLSQGKPPGFLYVHNSFGIGYIWSREQIGALARRNDALYAAEYLFTERMLSDPLLRSPYLSNASLFYVPTWAVFATSNNAYLKNRGHYLSLINKMSAASADFNATWSRNKTAHVFFFAGDKGACAVNRGPTFMTHWGLTVPWKHMVYLPPDYRPPENPNDVENLPCADGNDVIVPPNVGGMKVPPQATPPERYECELFFAGAPNYTLGRSSACGDPLHDKGWQRCYAQGLREVVFQQHQDRPGYCLIPHGERKGYDLARKSRFCLAPSGEGFGNRLSLSMLAGCVPVIIQPHVLQPLQDVLPYRRFSLSFNRSELPTMHLRLAQISSR